MRPWAMFPDPQEQALLVNEVPDLLCESLLASTDDGSATLVAAAAYDLFYAADDRAKADTLLRAAIASVGLAIVRMGVNLILAFRILHDGTSREQQQEFIDLCLSRGITIDLR